MTARKQCGCPVCDGADGELQTGPNERWGRCDRHLYKWPVPIRKAPKRNAVMQVEWRTNAMLLVAHGIVTEAAHAALA